MISSLHRQLPKEPSRGDPPVLVLFFCGYTRKSFTACVMFTLRIPLRRTGEDDIPLHNLYCLLYNTNTEPPSRSGSHARKSRAAPDLNFSRR